MPTPTTAQNTGTNLLLLARKIAIALNYFLLQQANDPRQCVKIGNGDANQPLHSLFILMIIERVCSFSCLNNSNRQIFLTDKLLPHSLIVIGNQYRESSHKN